MMLEESVSSLTSWFTPTVFFLLLQLVIATIYITSNLSSTNNKHNDQIDPHHFNQHHQPLPRSPSLLHRLKSINLYSYIPHTHHDQPPQQIQQQQQQQQLARSPSSMIQRLKSINLHTYFPTETFSSYFAHDGYASNSTTAAASFQEQDSQQKKKKSPHVPKTPLPKPVEVEEQESEEESDGGDVVGEIKNKLGDVRGEYDPASGSSSMDEIFMKLQEGQNGNFARTQSDTKPASGEVPVKLPKKMKKSASTKSAFSHFEEGDIVERRRPATARESGTAAAAEEVGGGAGGGEVDAKADDFINRFKQQLKLQRLDSIMRYKEMIGRGTAK